MDGIEYETVIPALRRDPDMTPEGLAIEINQSAATNKEKTGSAVALNAGWDALIVAVDEWAEALEEGIPALRNQYVAAFRSARSFWQDPTGKDLYDVAEKVKAHVKDTRIQNKSQAVMDAVDAVVLDEWHRTAYHGAHGITIFLPIRVQDLDDPSTPDWNEFYYYRNYLVFSQPTHWDDFLDAFVNGP
jgi:hypothetical protein